MMTPKFAKGSWLNFRIYILDSLGAVWPQKSPKSPTAERSFFWIIIRKKKKPSEEGLAIVKLCLVDSG
jgi:hypothetical protein